MQKGDQHRARQARAERGGDARALYAISWWTRPMRAGTWSRSSRTERRTNKKARVETTNANHTCKSINLHSKFVLLAFQRRNITIVTLSL